MELFSFLAQKNSDHMVGVLKIGEFVSYLCLLNFTCFDRLYGYPHALNFTAFKADANALNIGTEATSGVLDQTSSDTTALFGETFSDDTAASGWAFTCNCANT